MSKSAFIHLLFVFMAFFLSGVSAQSLPPCNPNITWPPTTTTPTTTTTTKISNAPPDAVLDDTQTTSRDFPLSTTAIVVLTFFCAVISVIVVMGYVKWNKMEQKEKDEESDLADVYPYTDSIS